MMTNCIEWSHYRMPNGYGQVRVGKRMRLAHVVACEKAHGPCPPGKQAAHSCGNRGCVNPEHLRWATPSENQADKYLHGTDRRGAKHPLARLTQKQVEEIRRRRGERHQSLADEFGVGRTQITRILNGTRW